MLGNYETTGTSHFFCTSRLDTPVMGKGETGNGKGSCPVDSDHVERYSLTSENP